jgi:hypothetical protein
MIQAGGGTNAGRDRVLVLPRDTFTTRSQRKIVHSKGHEGRKDRLLQTTLRSLCAFAVNYFVSVTL